MDMYVVCTYVVDVYVWVGTYCIYKNVHVVFAYYDWIVSYNVDFVVYNQCRIYFYMEQ